MRLTRDVALKALAAGAPEAPGVGGSVGVEVRPRRPHARRRLGGAGVRTEEGRTGFKLRDPRTGRWEAPSIPAATVDHPTWSRDGRAFHATASRIDEPGMQIARVDVTTHRVETVGRIEGLRPDGWLSPTPDGNLMVHRDVSQREIVVMDWEAR